MIYCTHSHGGQSCDFRGTKILDTCQKSLDSGKTFIDAAVNTGQICIGFKTDATEQLQKHAHPRRLWTTI